MIDDLINVYLLICDARLFFHHLLIIVEFLNVKAVGFFLF